MKPTQHRTSLAGALVTVLLAGCSVDQTDLVFLQLDGPVLLPAFSAPSDSLRRPRLSLSFSSTSTRVREGFLDTEQPNVDWPIDSISTPDGATSYPLRRQSSNNAATRWDLPSWQGNLLFEFPLDEVSVLGVAAHAYQGPTGSRWFGEARLGIDARSQAPLRFSLGGFYGRHDLKAAYLRRVNESAPLISWADSPQEMGGFFADLSIIPSAADRAVVPVMGITFVRQRILVHRVPSPDPGLGTANVAEWMSLWGLSLGIRGRVTSSVDVMIGARLVIDPSIDFTSTASFVLPLVQTTIHL